MSALPKQVRWLEAARDDLAGIVAHIAVDSPRNAERFAERILARALMLGDFPYLGSICPHYRKARQFIHGNYIIYYTVHRKEVVIRAVVHGAMLFRSWRLRRED